MPENIQIPDGAPLDNIQPFLPISGVGATILDNTFILPQVRPYSADQTKEIIENTVNYAKQRARQFATDKLEDSLIEGGVELAKLPGYLPRDVDGGYFSVTQSMFGQPVIGAITICPGGQEIINSNNLNEKIQLPELFVSTCLITLNQKKNNIYTPILGRTSTIKTFMNTNDYEITINGILVATDDPDHQGNYNGIYPYNPVQNLIDICEAPCMINIASDYLNLIRVSYIAIDSYEISQEEGGYSQQKFTITAYSDIPDAYQSIINF